MEPSQSLDTVSEDKMLDEDTHQTRQISAKTGKGKELKAKLQAALSRSTRKLFRRAPKSFHRFNDLPEELQSLIIYFAQAEPQLVEVLRPPARKVGHPLNFGLRCRERNVLLRVSHKFRQESLRIRPMSFSFSFDGLVLAQAAIPFDFAGDVLILPQEYLECLAEWAERGIKVDGLDKISMILVSWVSQKFSHKTLAGLVELRRGGVKDVGIINNGLLELAGKSTWATFKGPFWEEEKRFQAKLERRLRNYQLSFDGSFQVPAIHPLRLTRYAYADQRPPDWIYLRLKKWRDFCHSKGLSLHGLRRR